MKNLWFLIAAYSVVWVAIVGYLFVLIKRNKALLQQVNHLEQRLRRLEPEGD